MNLLKRLFGFNQSKEIIPLKKIEESKIELTIDEKYGEKQTQNILTEDIYPEEEFDIEDKNLELEINELQKTTEEQTAELIEKIARNEIGINNLDTGGGDCDPLFEEAARLIVQNQIGSTSLIQRRLKLGYNRTGRLMDQLEAAGIVGPNLGSKAREVRIKSEKELNEFLSMMIVDPVINYESFYEEHKVEIEKKKVEYLEQMESQMIEEEKELIRKKLIEKERRKQLEKEVLEELQKEGIISSTPDKKGRKK